MSSMDNLRAVKVFKWTKNESGVYEKTERCFGVFHGFGIERDDGEEPVSMALVEFDDGTVETVPPTFIEFLNPMVVDDVDEE